MRTGRTDPPDAAGGPMSRTAARTRVEIGVNPYEDGSGFAQTVEAERLTEKGEEVRRIWIKTGCDTCLLLPAAQWPALRDAIDRAVLVAFEEHS
jgi:hypothetical protein